MPETLLLISTKCLSSDRRPELTAAGLSLLPFRLLPLCHFPSQESWLLILCDKSGGQAKGLESKEAK
jgi:hypothetical protein